MSAPSSRTSTAQQARLGELERQHKAMQEELAALAVTLHAEFVLHVAPAAPEEGVTAAPIVALEDATPALALDCGYVDRGVREEVDQQNAS